MEIRTLVDLDIEKGRDPSTIAEEKRDVHRVLIRKSAHIDLNNIYAYLEGKADFGPGVIDAISKLRQNWFAHKSLIMRQTFLTM